MPDLEVEDPPVKPVSTADEELLKQIREDFKYVRTYWEDIRDEAARDMEFIANRAWTQDEQDERAGRPCLTQDELSQYVKQANNNLRQNKRAIKVTPKGLGATDDDAEKLADAIRGIEYKSNAQAAYTTAFEQAVECGFGAFRITTEYVDSETNNVEPRIKRIPNQFTVYFDPNAKEADMSDGEICFVTDVIRKSKFAALYPDAQKTSFSSEDVALAGDWLAGENVVIAEYWKVSKTYAKLKNGRKITNKTVTQRITNGIEILETNAWAGSWIPIIGVFGEEIYTNEGNESKRMFMSLIRRARDPQKILNFIASQETEEFSQTPRSPFIGYSGQFDKDADAWATLNTVPRAYIQVDPIVDAATGTVLPLPTRLQYTPNAQAFEVAREAQRRAIQAAMGIGNLPTAAQRQNEKSGVALEKIQTQQATGAFHYSDNFDRALENAGRQLVELVKKVVDTPRHIAARGNDDEHYLLPVGTQQGGSPKLQDGQSEADVLMTDKGDFDVTISTGPNFQSQREESSDFVDTLVQNLKNLPVEPPIAKELLSIAIKLKNLGPVGDKIADLLSPPDPNNLPPQFQAMAMQAKAQIQQLQQELQKLLMEREADAQKNQAMLLGKQMDNETKLAIAEISTKAQALSERMEFVGDLVQKLHVSAHERGIQAEEHAHAHEVADKQAALGLVTQAADHAQASGSQAADQAHQQQMAEQAADQQPAE